MTYKDGALIDNIAHHTKPRLGAEEFARKEIVALMGVRSMIEGQLHEIGLKAPLVEPEMPGIVRQKWVIAMAVHENSRDLGYAAGDVIAKLQASGEMEKDLCQIWYKLHSTRWIIPPNVGAQHRGEVSVRQNKRGIMRSSTLAAALASVVLASGGDARAGGHPKRSFEFCDVERSRAGVFLARSRLYLTIKSVLLCRLWSRTRPKCPSRLTHVRLAMCKS